jgi:uncharacterized protein (UPF0333 family)
MVDIKAQAGFEYLMVIGFMTAIIVPIAYFYIYSVDKTTEDVVQSTVDNIGRTFSDLAHDVYYSSGYAKRTLNLVVPEEVTSITGQRTREIIIMVETGAGPQYYTYRVDVPVGVQVDSSKIQGGYFVVEKRSNVVMLCAGQCVCSSSETCDDAVDNDCDGQADLCDNECAGTTDADNDGWTLECSIPDCNDASKRISPVSADVCGNGLDEDCDGEDKPC